MKIEANPPRLVDGSEFARILMKARERADSPQRLEASGIAVQHRIAELSAAGAAQSAATGMTLGKWAVALVAVAGGGVLLWSTSRNTEVVTPPAKVEVEVGPRPLDTIDRPAAPPEAVRPPARSAAAQAESSLPQQLALLQAARDAATAGLYPKALEILSRLESDYPASPLLLEAKIARVEYLAASGQLDDGLSAIAALLSERDLASRKGALFRLQGDLFVRHGRCDEAVVAYKRAIGLGLSDDDTSAARRGLQHCAQR